MILNSNIQQNKNERLVILDTETTGLYFRDGHRVIEIGCVEMINRKLTGNHFHVYLQPFRVMDDEAIKVHGITPEFLKDKPSFSEVSDDFLNFIKGAELIIHNAIFDVGFLNCELSLSAKPLIDEKFKVFDTLSFAKSKHPGQRNSLDALCKRYGIDNSKRTLHGALLDAEILADVYLLLTGGQFNLIESEEKSSSLIVNAINFSELKLNVVYANEDELKSHESKLVEINKESDGCLWLKIMQA